VLAVTLGGLVLLAGCGRGEVAAGSRSPALAPCAAGSLPPGQTVCRAEDGTGPITAGTVALPAPTVNGPAPLELRAVLAVRNGQCPPPADNPAATAGTWLAGADGSCYDLGPGLVAIHRATTRPQAQPDGITVAVDLSSTDGAALRSVLGGQVGRQFAMVMFGQVLSAPTVKDPSYTTDSIAIAPVDPQTPANDMRSLAG
jgi:hypothetical protein